MDHYRVYKLNRPNGRIIKGKDLLAADDREAMHAACEDPECPVCEVWRGAERIGKVD